MAININNLNSNNPVQQKQQAQAKQELSQSVMQADSHKIQVKSAGQDSVSITPQAKQLNDLQKKSAEGPGISQKKIDELKKAINDGDYKVDPEKLAASIANFEFKLL
jgi:negative regulator of flagellin synthesis FlgM